jgi:hypothetical protein
MFQDEQISATVVDRKPSSFQHLPAASSSFQRQGAIKLVLVTPKNARKFRIRAQDPIPTVMMGITRFCT